MPQTLATVPVNHLGEAGLTVSTLTAGDHVLRAVYTGNPRFTTSTSAPLTHHVT